MTGSSRRRRPLAAVPAYWSAECHTHVRLTGGTHAPRFQWGDQEQDRWRDIETGTQDEWDCIRQVNTMV
ncbi:MAG: hypothetical protein OXC13_18690 [Caldilineaceae bacterium]|nr:hypothetical protein [Caldilineaceae bacterium]